MKSLRQVSRLRVVVERSALF